MAIHWERRRLGGSLFSPIAVPLESLHRSRRDAGAPSGIVLKGRLVDGGVWPP
jgi:hypothetical protein